MSTRSPPCWGSHDRELGGSLACSFWAGREEKEACAPEGAGAGAPPLAAQPAPSKHGGSGQRMNTGLSAVRREESSTPGGGVGFEGKTTLPREQPALCAHPADAQHRRPTLDTQMCKDCEASLFSGTEPVFVTGLPPVGHGPGERRAVQWHLAAPFMGSQDSLCSHRQTTRAEPLPHLLGKTRPCGAGRDLGVADRGGDLPAFRSLGPPGLRSHRGPGWTDHSSYCGSRQTRV